MGQEIYSDVENCEQMTHIRTWDKRYANVKYLQVNADGG